ncbi:hypothetical protein F0562_028680 [Nyssa sinensis]|uniref:Uncharacterized protein n=1 Tax=Nyssa sinensis TaxID=561372 RepID=A0A5J5B2Y2_9ASTE|nr:hypothetical protein F0562_028680 [Nyssa sinensis]
MEDNLRPEVQPAFSDLVVTEGCRNELTPSNSASSALTVENSKDIFLQNANAIAGKCTAWTNEKHRLYLDSLEASFVNQLQHSMGLLAWCSDSSRQLPVNSCTSSDQVRHLQFTVLRDGCWQKINFEQNQPLLDVAADSHVFLDNPWICHFRCAGKNCTIASADLQQHRTLCSKVTPSRGKRAFSPGLATSLEELPVCHRCNQDTAGSITEVSDQNFVDEDQEEKSRTSTMAKRLKMLLLLLMLMLQAEIKLCPAEEKNKYVTNGHQKSRASSVQNLM